MPTVIMSTIGTGGSRDYSTIAGWVTGTAGDLVTDDEVHHGLMYADGPFNESVNIEGATTDATHWRTLYPASERQFYDPTDDSGLYWYSDSNVAKIKESYFKLHGPIKIECTYTGASARRCVNVVNTGITNCLVHAVYATMTGGTSLTNRGIAVDASTNSGCKINSCIVVGSSGSGGLTQGIYHGGASPQVYQCSVYNVDNGASGGTGITIAALTGNVAANNIAIGSGAADFSAGAGTFLNNISSDGTAPGTGSHTSQTAANTWEDAGSGDFTPNHSGNAVDGGTNLSALALDAFGFYSDFHGPVSSIRHNQDGGGAEIGALNHDTVFSLKPAGASGSVISIAPAGGAQSAPLFQTHALSAQQSIPVLKWKALLDVTEAAVAAQGPGKLSASDFDAPVLGPEPAVLMQATEPAVQASAGGQDVVMLGAEHEVLMRAATQDVEMLNGAT